MLFEGGKGSLLHHLCMTQDQIGRNHLDMELIYALYNSNDAWSQLYLKGRS